MRLTKNERACLDGARQLAEVGELIGPTSETGRVAIHSLATKGLLELVGWTGVGGTPLYRLTDAGRVAA